MQFERATGHGSLIVECDAGLQAEARALLERVSATAGSSLESQELTHGWADLALRESSGHLRLVQVRDYGRMKKDVPDLSHVLRSVRLHESWPRRLGVAPQPVHSRDTITGVVGWESLPAKLLQRIPPPLTIASGWVMGSPDDPAAPITGMEVYFDQLWTLMVDAPAVFPFLTLPTGFSILVEPETVAVRDPSGRTVWSGDSASAWELR